MNPFENVQIMLGDILCFVCKKDMDMFDPHFLIYAENRNEGISVCPACVEGAMIGGLLCRDTITIKRAGRADDIAEDVLDKPFYEAICIPNLEKRQ